MKYGAFIDGEAELVGTKGKAAKGFRFNAYLWVVDDNNAPVAEVFIKSLRVVDGVILPPATPSKFRTFPAVFLSREWAEKLYEAVNDDGLRDKFPAHYPLLDKAICVGALMFPATDYKRDFPRLAEAKGLLK